MSSLPIVLVGCGAVSQLFYTPALRTLAEAGELRVHALVDPVEPARTRLCEAFPLARGCTQLTEVDAPRGALAIIASPPRWHAEQTLAAVARGWHVLCEKPMAASGDEAAQMISAAASADRVLAIGHYKRFFPSSFAIKALCSPSGALGALRRFDIAEGGPFNWPAASAAFFQRRETPGGVLLDIGVHVFDLLLWWLGAPSEFTYADDAMGGLEANARIALRFGPVEGRIQLSRDWATAQLYRFEFQHGVVNWTVNNANGLEITLTGVANALRGALHDSDGKLAASNAQSFIAQLRHVVTAIRNHSPVLVDGREGVRALHLIEACYSRRRPLAQPWLSTAETENAALRVSRA